MKGDKGASNDQQSERIESGRSVTEEEAEHRRHAPETGVTDHDRSAEQTSRRGDQRPGAAKQEETGASDREVTDPGPAGANVAGFRRISGKGHSAIRPAALATVSR